MNGQSILYLLLWAAGFALMMRFGCGAHVFGHRSGHGSDHSGTSGNDVTSGQATDPVCGMSVQREAAKSSLYGGRAYFFCSGTCRDKFEESPHTYAGKPLSQATPREHHHGC